MKKNNLFLKNKSILITGAKGFIGKNLIKEFKNKYKIFCLDKNNCDLKIKKKIS